tara:strand:+ start:352 stop:843 length:492 start_codon:yes stop_codon:yes gene_type:complete
MAFTRFHDDPCRIQKYLEESTNVGNYQLNVPGYGDKPYFINDPYVKIQKWGANLSQNATDLENDLLGLTRKLNRDTIKENNYVDYLNNNNLFSQNVYPVNNSEITHQPRATDPAWTVRETDSINTPNNFKYLHMNPQEHVCIPFHNNVSTRIVEKDIFSHNIN